ncbi:MAG TPA: YHS domain-containing protein [Chloroflexota bacterium]|jgi:YHS domain-containing protein|nr:YHS domain-containing protein [Chloroflexota bacterium]
MPADPDFAQAVRVFHQVSASPAFVELTAEPNAVGHDQADAAGLLRSRGVELPPEVTRVEGKRRHPTQAEWDRGWRTGGIEWRFFIQAGEKLFRLMYVCDPWAREVRGTAAAASTATAKDPVCGMDVDPATAKQKSDYQGQTYYFCAPGCKKAFDADPEKYLDPAYQPSM